MSKNHNVVQNHHSTQELKLSDKDVNKVIARWYITTEMSLNFERMQSIAYTYSLIPAFKVLYPEKEDRAEAMQRHLELFNTNATSGGLILGTTLAMEEQKANNPEQIPGSSIIAIKTGLMGPVAALGDSFSAGTITTLFILTASSIARTGSMLGFWVLLLGTMVTLFELIFFTKLTYRKGREAIQDVLSSKIMKDVIDGANILGLTMMGALTASMVNLEIAYTTTFNEAVFSIQDKIDGIMPGILTIGVLFVYYYLINEKGVSVAKIVLLTIVVALIGAFFGIL